MNDRMKHQQVTGQLNRQTADTQAAPFAKPKEPFFVNAPLTIREITYPFRPMKRLLLLTILLITSNQDETSIY